MASFSAPHELVADGGEEVLRVHADEMDGEGSPAEVDGDGAREGDTARVHAEGEGLQMLEGLSSARIVLA